MVWCGVMYGVTMCKANRSRAYATVLGGAVAIAGLERKNHPRRSTQWVEALRSAVLVRLLIAAQKSVGTKRLSGSTSLLETALACHPKVDFQLGVTPCGHTYLQLGPQSAHSEYN